MTKKRRTATQFFDVAETHGLEPLMKTDLNSDKVSRYLVFDTETTYTVWQNVAIAMLKL